MNSWECPNYNCDYVAIGGDRAPKCPKCSIELIPDEFSVKDFSPLPDSPAPFADSPVIPQAEKDDTATNERTRHEDAKRRPGFTPAPSPLVEGAANASDRGGYPFPPSLTLAEITLLREHASIEKLAEAVHDAYLETCARLGWSVKPENQVPYSALTDDSKELDRASVLAVLTLMQRKAGEAQQVVCPWCHGQSSVNNESGCTTCGGHGWIWEQTQPPAPDVLREALARVLDVARE